MATTDDDFMATILADIEKREEARIESAKTRLKDEIIPRLKKRGVATVRAYYSGYGDEGIIETVEFFDAADKPVAMRKSRSARLPPLDQTLCRIFLDFLPSGFENNDGGQGDITIEVQAGTVMVEHQQNYVEHSHSDREFVL